MNQLITKDEQLPWDRTQVDLIKRTIAKDATDDELKLFGLHCARTGLDPLAKQIFFQKRKSSSTGEATITFVTSIDGFRLIAARTGEHAGTDDATFDNEREPNKASVTVYRIVKGERCAFTASARWDEYYPGDKQGFMWKKMPCTMLAKCAESLALRKAFPNELSNMYTKEEMDQAPEPDQTPPPPSTKKTTTIEQKPAVITTGVTASQRKLAWDKVKELGFNDDEAKTFLIRASGKKYSSEWTPEDYSKVLEKIAELKKANPQTHNPMTEAQRLEQESNNMFNS